MRMYRNLALALLSLSLFSLLLLIPFTQATLAMASITWMGIFIAVFAVSLVAFLASLTMYFSSKNAGITVLKRRAGRVYGELLHHKILLISAMDGDKHLSDWDHYLYDRDEFPRLKKFLGEEYFLLLSCDSFFPRSAAARAYNDFKSLHNDLAAFMRSVSYDRIEYVKFKKLFALTTGREMTSKTPEEKFTCEPFSEAYEALQAANEQSLRTIEALLARIEKYEIELDRYYSAGTAWKTTKKGLDARYQLWLHATEV
ncbi:hypothetical protein [uncultured Mailhella sp.]|uniref:hypothetical protein n=1 Tax=uncultured Mailhella sp. TaxID=1981031 RepID=UPI0026113BC3|nr:hypothetical protein [uncultured Mailhella sp.]